MGVILAAGDGVRMEPFSRELPKPLLPVLGRPVVEHQLALLRTLGVEDVVIVVGRAGEAIEAALAERAPEGLRLRYVEQAAPRGIAHAVGVTEPLVDRPFVLLLGDIFLRTRAPERLRAMHAEGHAAVLAATPSALDWRCASSKDVTSLKTDASGKRKTGRSASPRRCPVEARPSSATAFSAAYPMSSTASKSTTLSCHRSHRRTGDTATLAPMKPAKHSVRVRSRVREAPCSA